MPTARTSPRPPTTRPRPSLFVTAEPDRSAGPATSSGPSAAGSGAGAARPRDHASSSERNAYTDPSLSCRWRCTGICSRFSHRCTVLTSRRRCVAMSFHESNRSSGPGGSGRPGDGEAGSWAMTSTAGRGRARRILPPRLGPAGHGIPPHRADPGRVPHCAACRPPLPAAIVRVESGVTASRHPRSCARQGGTHMARLVVVVVLCLAPLGALADRRAPEPCGSHGEPQSGPRLESGADRHADRHRDAQLVEPAPDRNRAHCHLRRLQRRRAPVCPAARPRAGTRRGVWRSRGDRRGVHGVGRAVPRAGRRPTDACWQLARRPPSRRGGRGRSRDAAGPGARRSRRPCWRGAATMASTAPVRRSAAARRSGNGGRRRRPSGR